MLEPRFEKNFNVEKKIRSRKDEKDEVLEQKLFNRRYRKEMRGAMKELRKDSQFIARSVYFFSDFFSLAMLHASAFRLPLIISTSKGLLWLSY